MSNDIETLLASLAEAQRHREALEAEIADRTTRLQADLKLGKLFSPPPKGQKSPFYKAASGVVVRLMGATKVRQWVNPTDAKVLALVHKAPSRNLLTAKEIILKAAKFDSKLVNRQYAEGKLTEEQIEAIYETKPSLEWRLSIRSTGASVPSREDF
jgi:hypothetical protein